MSKETKVTVTVYTVPHPNPQAAINLMAGLVLKNYLAEIEQGGENDGK